jgi:hypothetical protein
MADVSGKFYSATKVRTGVSPSSPGVEVGETLPPVNPPGSDLNSVGLTMPTAFAVANSPLTSNGTLEVTGAGTTAQYIRGDGSLASFPSLTGYVPYTGATADVDLGTHDLTAERGIFTNNGSSDTLTVNHTSGSGYGIKVTKGGNNEALLVTKTSGSGNAMAVVGGRTALVDLSLSSVSNATGNFLTISGGVVHQRTASETRSDVGAQAQLNGTGFVKASGTTISYDNSTYQVTSDKAQPNGYASLDSNGKVPLTQINDALIGNVNYQGLWNASTNTPTLANPPSSGTKGYYYIVSTAGTFAGISFEVGDWIISNGSAWQKVDNTDAVSSVFGRTGNVVAANGDYTTAQVTESGNLYYTDGRARGALSFAAGSGAYNSSTGVITIPTNNNQITNGAGYITSAGTITGASGALSSRDNRTISPSEDNAGQLKFGFTSWANNDSSPYADYLHLRSYTDNSGGNDNLVMFLKSAIGMRIYQQSFGSASAYSSFKDIAFTDGTNSSGTWGINITGNASTANTWSTAITITIGNTGKSVNGSSNVSWSLAEIGAQAALTNPVTGTGNTNYLSKFTSNGSTVGNSAFFDGGGFGGFNSTGIGSRTFVINAASGRPLALEVVEFANVHSMSLRPNNSGFNAISSNYLSGGTFLPLSISGRENNADLVLQTNGNVTIGNTSDNGFKLDVNGTGRFNNILVANSDIHQVSTGGLYWGAASTYVIGVTGNTANGNLSFITGSTVKLTIASTGAATFSSSVTAGVLSKIGDVFIGGRSGTYSTYTDGVFGDNLHLGATGTGGAVYINTALSRNLIINPVGGNVLIGTTTDNGNKLRVNGTIFSDSSVTATSFFESSDATLKTLVEDAYQAKGIDSVVAKLYIKNGKQELGYYAQDLEGVLPSAVSKGSNGLLNLSYREVHTAKIAYLEEEIRQIKKRYEIN